MAWRPQFCQLLMNLRLGVNDQNCTDVKKFQGLALDVTKENLAEEN